MKEFLCCLFVLFLAKSMICEVGNETTVDAKLQADDVAEADYPNSVEDHVYNDNASVEKLIRANTVDCVCGQTNNANKIVGGQPSGDHAWPWAAAIIDVGSSGNDTPRVFCGASLICNKYILTAAHCVPNIMSEPSRYRVLLGDNKITNSSDESRTVVGIDKIFPHPKYNSTNQDFDAALIRVNVTLNFTTNMCPICLGQLGRPFVNRQATVCGWGTTFFGGAPVNELMDTRIRTIRNDVCAKAYDGSGQPITNNMICAYTEGKDTCQGDSGGPMFVNRTTRPTIFKQIGITSTGIGCNEKKPGIYTRVQRIIAWIKHRTSDCSYCEDSFNP